MRTTITTPMPAYTFRPGIPPSPQDAGATLAYHRAESIDSVARRASDFFQQSDNGPEDLDPRLGFVRLKDAPAPRLLERVTTTVSGFRTPWGELSVIGKNAGHYGLTSLDLSPAGREATMDRPLGLNDRYGNTLEHLIYQPDGSLTLNGNYYYQADRLD